MHFGAIRSIFGPRRRRKLSVLVFLVWIKIYVWKYWIFVKSVPNFSYMIKKFWTFCFFNNNIRQLEARATSINREVTTLAFCECGHGFKSRLLAHQFFRTLIPIQCKIHPQLEAGHETHQQHAKATFQKASSTSYQTVLLIRSCHSEPASTSLISCTLATKVFSILFSTVHVHPSRLKIIE